MTFFRTGAEASTDLYEHAAEVVINMKDIYFGGVSTMLGAYATREGLTTFATTGLVVCRNAGRGGRNARAAWRVITLAPVVGFVVAAGTTFGASIRIRRRRSQTASPQRNYCGAEAIPQREIAAAVDQYGRGRFLPKEYNSPLNMGIGFGVTALLEAASLRWASLAVFAGGVCGELWNADRGCLVQHIRGMAGAVADRAIWRGGFISGRSRFSSGLFSGKGWRRGFG